MSEVNTIGARLRQARQERGLTQEELAERSGVSNDVIRKLEQERRNAARITTLTHLANALSIPLSDLLGGRERLGPLRDGGVMAVRNTLLAVHDLPGIDLSDNHGEPSSLDELDAVVERCWQFYWSGQFGDLTAMLPDLVSEACVTQRVIGVRGSGALAQAYQLCANLVAQVGYDDLAMIAIERALGAAVHGDDELQHATLLGTAAWIYMRQGRYGDAERVASAAAQRIEPPLSKATPEHLTVWGSLMLWAAAAAAAAARADEAADYIGLARAAAGRFDEDRHDYWTNFGPTQVAMQATHTFSVLGKPTEALRAAERVRRSDLLHISYGVHQLDVARACLEARRNRDAAEALSEALGVSTEWFRSQADSRGLVRDLIERERRMTPALRQLALSVGLN